MVKERILATATQSSRIDIIVYVSIENGERAARGYDLHCYFQKPWKLDELYSVPLQSFTSRIDQRLWYRANN